MTPYVIEPVSEALLPEALRLLLWSLWCFVILWRGCCALLLIFFVWFVVQHNHIFCHDFCCVSF